MVADSVWSWAILTGILVFLGSLFIKRLMRELDEREQQRIYWMNNADTLRAASAATVDAFIQARADIDDLNKKVTLYRRAYDSTKKKLEELLDTRNQQSELIAGLEKEVALFKSKAAQLENENLEVNSILDRISNSHNRELIDLMTADAIGRK